MEMITSIFILYIISICLNFANFLIGFYYESYGYYSIYKYRGLENFNLFAFKSFLKITLPIYSLYTNYLIIRNFVLVYIIYKNYYLVVNYCISGESTVSSTRYPFVEGNKLIAFLYNWELNGVKDVYGIYLVKPDQKTIKPITFFNLLNFDFHS